MVYRFFLCMYVCLMFSTGEKIVLIKYSGKQIEMYFILKITFQHELYIRAFNILNGFAPIVTLEDEQSYSRRLSQLLDDHKVFACLLLYLNFCLFIAFVVHILYMQF